MPNRNDLETRQNIQKILEQNEELITGLKSMKTQFGIALGQVLQNQELAKPIQDEILKFTDDWWGTKFSDFGFPQ